MNKKLKLLALMATITSIGYAASIDHIQTYTPEYLGNQAQTGMINNTSVYYNPAGLTNLDNGKYVHAGLQLAVGHEKMNYGSKEYKADLLQPIPNFAAYMVDEDSSLYWTFGGLGGGGDLKYKDGVAGTAVVPDLISNGKIDKKAILSKFDPAKLKPILPLLPPHLGGLIASPNDPTITEILGIKELYDAGSSAEGSNLYIQTTLGRTFKVDDKLSLSAGFRLVHASRKLKANIKVNGITEESNLMGKPKKVHGIEVPTSLDPDTTIPFEASIDSERTAWGYGFQLGANYKVNKRLNLSARYDSRVKLNMKAKGSMTNAQLGPLGQLGLGNFYPEYIPGTKVRRDLPAILSLGGSYKVTDVWTMGLTGNFYFNKQAKMDRISGKVPFKGAEQVKAKYKNGWELALGTEYQINPKWTVLGSINYAHTGATAKSFDDVEFALNSITLGLGAKYKLDTTSELAFGVSHFFYQEKSGHYNVKYNGIKEVKNPRYDKSITAVGVSYTKKF